MSLAARSTLGRYRIERRLGAGAMGEVYLASDPHIDRQLAIKTVLLGDAGAVEVEERRVRLMREAKAAGRLVHPHVVTLFDAGEADGVFYLAFEYVNGPDLAARQRISPPLTLGDVLRIGRQAAEGLDAAHRQGIVHRDIKPSNILLDAGGGVKISDFGIAKMLGQGTELTQTGSVVGSPHYLSPEQIRGEELDGRSDLFSLGVVLYELLTRHRPFEGDTITTLVYQILAREPLPIGGMRPNLPPRLESAVGRLLAKDRDQRFASARELADELAAAERELPREMLAVPAVVPSEAMDETHRLSSTPPPPPPPGAPATPAGSGGERITHRAFPTPSGEQATPAGPPLVPPPPGAPPAGSPAASPGSPTAPTSVRPQPPGSAPSVPPAPAASLANAGSMAPIAMPRRKGGFPWAVLVVLGVLALLGVGGATGVYFWLRGKGIGPFAPATSTAAVDPARTLAAQPDGPATTNDSPFEKPASLPADRSEDGPREQPPPIAVPSPAERPPAIVPAAAPAAAPPAVAPSARPAAPARTPTPAPRPTVAEAPRSRDEPANASPPRPSTADAQPAPTRAEPARPAGAYGTPEPPAAPAPAERFDHEMTTGLSLKFSVPSPDDVFLGIKQEGDRRFTSIGKAADFDAEKKKLPGYDLPGPGIYYLRLVSEGRELIYRLEARSGPPSVITVNIGPSGRRRRG